MIRRAIATQRRFLVSTVPASSLSSCCSIPSVCHRNQGMRFPSSSTTTATTAAAANKPRDLFADDGAVEDDPAALLRGGNSSSGSSSDSTSLSTSSSSRLSTSAEPKTATATTTAASSSSRPKMTNIGIDPMNADMRDARMGGGTSVRFEVQVTVMHSQMATIETRLSSLRKQRQQLSLQQQQQQEQSPPSGSTKNRTVAMLAAQWMSVALNLSSLLESEQGHSEEVCLLLKKVLDKLGEPEFAGVDSATKKKSNNVDNDGGDEDDSFFANYNDALRTGTLIRLARAKLELLRNEEALDHCNDAIASILRRHLLQAQGESDTSSSSSPSPSPPLAVSSTTFVRLLNRACVLQEWLCLCKLKSMALGNMGRHDEEQSFLADCLAVEKLLAGEVVILSGQSDNDSAAAAAMAADIAANRVVVIGSNQSVQQRAGNEEVIVYLELLLRYADSLGLSADGKSWLEADHEIFGRKRRLLNAISYLFAGALSPTHPLVTQARASLALDCGGVAVSLAESKAVLTALIHDVSAELEKSREAQHQSSSIDHDAEKKRREKEIEDVLLSSSSNNNSANDNAAASQSRRRLNNDSDLFAQKHAVLIWKRKLGIVLAQLDGEMANALQLLETTSAEADKLLGVTHVDSILTLRCWMKAAYFARNKKLFDQVTVEIEKREAPPSI